MTIDKAMLDRAQQGGVVTKLKNLIRLAVEPDAPFRPVPWDELRELAAGPDPADLIGRPRAIRVAAEDPMREDSSARHSELWPTRPERELWGYIRVRPDGSSETWYASTPQ